MPVDGTGSCCKCGDNGGVCIEMGGVLLSVSSLFNSACKCKEIFTVWHYVLFQVGLPHLTIF